MGRISGNSTKMVSGTLFTYPGNFRAEKILSVAKMSESDVKVDDKFVFGETNKSDAFLKKFPLGKVSAFEGSDGTWLFESDASAWYVANAQLKGGSTPVAQAAVAQWMAFAQNEVLPAACTWVFPTMGIMAFNKNATERAKEDVKKAMDVLNKALLTKTYLVGERITLADVCVAYAMKMLFENVLEPGCRGGRVWHPQTGREDGSVRPQEVCRDAGCWWGQERQQEGSQEERGEAQTREKGGAKG